MATPKTIKVFTIIFLKFLQRLRKEGQTFEELNNLTDRNLSNDS